jgi:hypothetical protein
LAKNRHYTQIVLSAIFLSDYNTMTSADVIDIYSTLGGLGIKIWIDGGWGVDALLGRQTRPHKDLDIALDDTSSITTLDVNICGGH